MPEFLDIVAIWMGRILLILGGVSGFVWIVTIAMDYSLKSSGIWFEIVVAVAERRRIKACKNGTIETQPRRSHETEPSNEAE